MTGRDDKTLVLAFRKIGYFPKPGERIQFRYIEAALFGEEHTEKVRAMRLDNEERERKAKERDGVLLEWEVTERFWMQHFVSPMTAALDAAPDEVSREWTEKVLKPLLRQELKAPKKEVGK